MYKIYVEKKFVEMKESLVREKKKNCVLFLNFHWHFTEQNSPSQFDWSTEKCAVTCPQVLNMDKHGVERSN